MLDNMMTFLTYLLGLFIFSAHILFNKGIHENCSRDNIRSCLGAKVLSFLSPPIGHQHKITILGYCLVEYSGDLFFSMEYL